MGIFLLLSPPKSIPTRCAAHSGNFDPNSFFYEDTLRVGTNIFAIFEKYLDFMASL